jgi:rod shape-determining protein MreD
VRALVALSMFGGGIAQATIVPALRIGDVTPDIPLIMVVLLALRRGAEWGCLAGFVVGLMEDVAGGGLVGVQALTKAMVGFAIGAAAPRLRVTQPVVQVSGLVLLSVAEALVRFALLKVFHFRAAFGELMMYVVLPQALYNGFIGAALALAMAWAQTQRRRPL